jgi:hypothetical protein
MMAKKRNDSFVESVQAENAIVAETAHAYISDKNVQDTAALFNYTDLDGLVLLKNPLLPFIKEQHTG